ncbi:MAG: CoA-binding protein [Bacteroidetes bacterium]|nr:CoA-binding protein [Bacteroidota bacterium]MBS1740967.1 CoA-binding protein [Bacteroidota bacterium]MBS1777245.1 CoA-binding protein [Bacteroidota bacterium]
MNKNGKTLVLGASENPDRYSNKAIKQLRAHGFEVVAIGHKIGKVADVEIGIEPIAFSNIDTVTLYLNPTNQKPYYDYIKALKPRRIIFNPGTENEELERILAQTGVNTMEACTLVLLSTGQY